MSHMLHVILRSVWLGSCGSTPYFVVVSVCTRHFHHNPLITCITEHTRKQNAYTALSTSVMNDDVEIVSMLLDAGAEHFDTKGVCENMMRWTDCKVCVEGADHTRIGL